MSFEQHPDQDDQGRDSQGAESTGRIYGPGDDTAQLPSHPRPEGSFGGGPHPDRPQQGGSYPNPPSPYGPGPGGQANQQPPRQQPPRQQQPYGGPPANGPYPGPHPGPGSGAGYGAPTYGGPTRYDTGNGGPRRPKGRGWAAVPVAAVLAAALASAGTYALTDHNSGSAAAGGSHTTVVQANPNDFADAGTVNWSATASKVGPSVVSITVVSGSAGDQGSGVILDTSGDVVTNNHVVNGAGSGAKVTVTLNDNRTYGAKVIGTDASTDLAVVRIDSPPTDLKPITLGDDKGLVVGQPVMAVGNPLGLAGTVTTGIVSALNRPITTQQDSQSGAAGSQDDTSTTNAIQTSAAINPGNSGGALVDGSGKLIGINSSIATLGQSSASSQSGNIGIGFAIPVTVVSNITSQLMRTGKVKHPQIGVKVDTTGAAVKLGNASVQGARIDEVNSGSPAAKAGLKAGDVVTKFDGQQLGSPAPDSLIAFVRAENVGDKVTLTIVRDGKQQNVTVTLGEASSG